MFCVIYIELNRSYLPTRCFLLEAPSLSKVLAKLESPSYCAGLYYNKYIYIMNACKACSERIDDNDKYVLCSGACNRLFHVNCAGLNLTNFKAWSSNVGLLWFCDACRVNFNPIVMDRENHILKALRDLLVRVDSMDLRIGQYAENLKTMNSLLYFPHTRRESSADLRFQQHSAGSSTIVPTEFHRSIDRINLDGSLNSLGCSLGDNDEPTFSATTCATVTNCTATLTTTAIDTPTTTVASNTSGSSNTTSAPPAAVPSAVSTITSASAPNSNEINNRAPCTLGQSNRLRVIDRSVRRRQQANTTEALDSFYITPFHVEQTEDDVLAYLRETFNTENSTIQCVKLVPRGKQVNDLTFVSFKVSVSSDLKNVVSDSFYWPDGVNVREFLPKNDTAPMKPRLPSIQQ